MARPRKSGQERVKAETEPKFPYTTAPAALRRRLQEILKRPKPGRMTLDTLKTWKVTSTNEATPLRVLKSVGLLGPTGEPLQGYVDFMQSPPSGPRSFGGRLRERYKDLFETSHEPHKNGPELKTFFNIHSGGGERAIELQVQTFKALSEFADFSGSEVASGSGSADVAKPGPIGGAGGGRLPPLQIDLHIHLPETRQRGTTNQSFRTLRNTSTAGAAPNVDESGTVAGILGGLAQLAADGARLAPGQRCVAEVSAALEEFNECVRYLNTRRSAGAILQLDSEAAIQDALYLMLRPWVPDIVAETPTERVGNRFGVPDFKSRSLRLVVEAKFVRDKQHGRNISKELHDDIEVYRHDIYCDAQ